MTSDILLSYSRDTKIKDELLNLCVLHDVHACLLYRIDSLLLSSEISDSYQLSFDLLNWLQSIVRSISTDPSYFSFRKSIYEIFDCFVVVYPIKHSILCVISRCSGHLNPLLIEIRSKASKLELYL